MSDRVFIDTNVLIYTRDRNDDGKREKARTWLRVLAERQSACINLQVLNEFTNWALKKESHRSLESIRAEVDELRLWGDKPLDDDDVEMAWLIRTRFGFQWFDCLLFAAAERQGCRYFLTEDMQHLARFDVTTLINPFVTSPSELLFHH